MDDNIQWHSREACYQVNADNCGYQRESASMSQDETSRRAEIDNQR